MNLAILGTIPEIIINMRLIIVLFISDFHIAENALQ